MPRRKKLVAIEGVVDQVAEREVSGWVFQPDSPETYLVVTARLADRVIGSATASTYRADLEEAGVGRGDHAFVIRLKTALRPDEFADVTIGTMSAQGDHEIIPLGPDATMSAEDVRGGTSLYAEDADLLPPVGYPADFIDDAILEEYVAWTGLHSTEMAERIRRDTLPVPHAYNREGYAPDSTLLYWLSGYADYANIAALAKQHDVNGGRYLDFGGSTGRVFRHFSVQNDAWDVWSCDFKPSSVDFNLRHFPSNIRPFLNNSLPSLPLPDGYFDLITACSVFTHIDETETSWLLELRRILKIGGIACISVHNEDTWANMIPDLRATVEEFRPDIASAPILPAERIIVNFRTDNDPYRCNSFHSDNYVRRNWGRYFNIREIRPLFLGEQAMVVCQRVD